jgi:hypothetical protein
MPRGLPQFKLPIPFAHERGAAGDQHRQWQPNEKCPETNTRPSGVPVNYLLGRVSRLVLERLHIAQEERGHEENGGKDEEHFRSSDGVSE